jgi:hypothetical protein
MADPVSGTGFVPEWFMHCVVYLTTDIDTLSREDPKGFVDPRNANNFVVFAESFAKKVTDCGLVFNQQNPRAGWIVSHGDLRSAVRPELEHLSTICSAAAIAALQPSLTPEPVRISPSP